MKKLRLRPDELAVESFPTSPSDGKEQGTVHAHDSELCGDTPNGVCLPYSTECYATDGKNTHCGYCLSEYNCTFTD